MTEKRNPRLRVDRIVAVALALAALALLVPLVPDAWRWMAYREHAPMPEDGSLSDQVCQVARDDGLQPPQPLFSFGFICENNWGRAKRFDWLPGPTWIEVRRTCVYQQQVNAVHRDYVFKDGELVALSEDLRIDEVSLARMLDTPPGEAICFACARDGHDACTATFAAAPDSEYELAAATRLSGLPSLKPGDYRCICHRTGPCARKAVRP